MVRRALILFAITICTSSPVQAGQGLLATLALGRYVCERPAEPGSQIALTDADASFAVTRASRYVAADGTQGTYLLSGNAIEMTSGRLAGTRLVRLRDSFLRVLGADGVPGSTRCVLSRISDKH